MKKLFTIYLILFSFISFAQNRKIDSLQQALKNFDTKKIELNQKTPDESDTIKVNILIELGKEVNQISDYDAAIKNGDEALAISQQINFKNGTAKSHSIIGIANWYKGNYPEALKNHSAALKIREEIGDKIGIASTYSNIAVVYKAQANYPEALKNSFLALKMREEIGDKNAIAASYNNIGNIYQQQMNSDEALKYFILSLKIREEIGDKNAIASSKSGIADVYARQGKYSDALKSYYEVLKIREEAGNKNLMAATYNAIGNVCDMKRDFPESAKNYSTALKIYEEIGDENDIANISINIAASKLQLGLAVEGKKYLVEALRLSKKIGATNLIRDSYEYLSYTDSALGNFKDAFENHKLFILYRDSLRNEENIKKQTQIEMQYVFDKKEAAKKIEQDVKDGLATAEINRNKQQKYFMYGILFFALGFAYWDYRKKRKITKAKKEIEIEKKRSDDLLHNIFPTEIANELKSSGTSKAKAFTMVTVMFTDFKDFTTVSEKISAELLVDEIHHCFSAFDNILQKYNIEKIKTIGDAYMCASGLPVSNHTHAIDMVNCAMEIRNFMIQRKKEKEAKREIPFEIRIGIHTGSVVAGIVGIKKYAYDIWGDTVNIAARMEQNSDAGKINISGTTYELVKDILSSEGIKFEHRGKISAKNKGEIDMYYIG